MELAPAWRGLELLCAVPPDSGLELRLDLAWGKLVEQIHAAVSQRYAITQEGVPVTAEDPEPAVSRELRKGRRH